MDILGGIKAFVKGLLVGLLSGAVIVTILLTLAQVVRADESISTREARLGEQDRSLNYKYTDSSGVEFEHVIILGTVSTAQCEQTNQYLTYTMERIAKYIAQNPELGYIYKDALLSIRRHWCEN